jgi:hypothetical protein
VSSASCDHRRRGKLPFSLGALAFLSACASTSAPSHSSGDTERVAPQTAAQPPRPSPEGSEPTVPAPEPTPLAYDSMHFVHVLDVPVRSIALGKAPKAAVLADAAYVFDGDRFEKRGVPSDGSLEIFFGRDNQPRLMGTRRSADGTITSVYLRLRASGFRPEPSELGPLARARGGLYGLLGFADPEVVCSPGFACLVKRESGWTRIEADAEPTPMFLTDRGVYKATGSALLRLEGSAWTVARQAFAPRPSSLCHRTDTELWMVAEGSVLVLAGAGAPSAVETPVRSPKAIYCAAEDSLWVVGESGAAHHDGTEWSIVPGDLGQLTQVTGRGKGEIWFGGTQGVFLGLVDEAPRGGE